MTETSCYLGNHPKSHLECWSKQPWSRPRVMERPFSEAGRFYKPSYPILARFDSLFCILLVQPRPHAFCQWSRQGQFLDQRPVLPRRKQAPSGVSSALNILSGIDQCYKEQSIVSHINRTLSYLNAMFYSSLRYLKITHLWRIHSLCIL